MTDKATLEAAAQAIVTRAKELNPARFPSQEFALEFAQAAIYAYEATQPDTNAIQSVKMHCPSCGHTWTKELP